MCNKVVGKIVHKIEIVLIVTLSVSILYVGSVIGFTFYNHKDFSPRPVQTQYVIVPKNMNYKISRAQYKELVDNAFNTYYHYIESDTLSFRLGRSNVALRNVYIQKSDTWQYEMILAHELSHIKYMSANECYITYKAITTLYESDNEYLKNVAIEYANYVFSGGVPESYDCSGYLVSYFKL